MKHIRTITLTALAALAAGAAPALAHTGVPGHEHGGLAAGLMHPVSGLDHLLAMLAVGIWSALAAKGDTSKVWMAPAAFVTAMIGGAAAGYSGLPLPLVETGIALSVLVLGIMIAARVELPALLGAGLVAFFAIYHGHAHGAEAVGSIAAYMTGFALVTASLHIGGIVLGMMLQHLRHAPAVAGGLIAAAGAWLLTA
jgi:urease accessory protein